MKAQVAALLQGGREGTLEQLLAATGGKEVSLKTALSDLKSDKYAGATGKLNIVRTETGTYTRAKVLSQADRAMGQALTDPAAVSEASEALRSLLVDGRITLVRTVTHDGVVGPLHFEDLVDHVLEMAGCVRRVGERKSQGKQEKVKW